MLTRRETQKLKREMTIELHASARTVVLCALSLLLLWGLSWVGASGDGVTTTVTVKSAR